MTIKVKRGDQEIEIDEAEKQDGDVLVTSQEKKGITFTDEQQQHVNNLIATEKRKLESKYASERKVLEDRVKEYETKEQEAENKLKERLEELKKNADPEFLELIEDAPLEKQIAKLEKYNKVNKPNLPDNPNEKGDGETKQKPLGVIF